VNITSFRINVLGCNLIRIFDRVKR